MTGFSSPFLGIQVGAATDFLSTSGSGADFGLGIGSLTIIDGSLDATTSAGGTPAGLSVGFADANEDQYAEAEGSFGILNGAGSGETMTVGFVQIGAAKSFGDNAESKATGQAQITNTEVSAVGLTIGRANVFFNNSAEAHGSLTVEGSTVNVTGGFGDGSSAFIGSAGGNFTAFGTASGSLILTDSIFTIENDLFVAQQGQLNSVATGEISLTRSLLDVGDMITLGEGSTLYFGIDGQLRADEYGAIDAGGMVVLDGAAVIEFGVGFDFASALGVDFDLIVAEGFSGTFFDTVNFLGLDANYAASASIADVNSEAFRITISEFKAIPEPPALLLFGFGLVGLFFVAGRRRPA